MAIGIGSNQGDSVRICKEVIARLRSHTEIRAQLISSLYRTKPHGVEGQQWYVNGAVVCETEFEPLEVLKAMQELETEFGRVRTTRWGPRTLDLDILFYDDIVIDLPGLQAPHPLMSGRLFVLAPLAEIEPDWIHPMLGLTVREMLERVLLQDDQQAAYKLDE